MKTLKMTEKQVRAWAEDEKVAKEERAVTFYLDGHVEASARAGAGVARPAAVTARPDPTLFRLTRRRRRFRLREVSLSCLGGFPPRPAGLLPPNRPTAARRAGPSLESLSCSRCAARARDRPVTAAAAAATSSRSAC